MEKKHVTQTAFAIYFDKYQYCPCQHYDRTKFCGWYFYYRNIYFGNRGHRYCAHIRYARLWRSSSKCAHLVVFHNRSDAGNIIRICLRAIQSKWHECCKLGNIQTCSTLVLIQLSRMSRVVAI